MPDTKITALTALTAADPANDVLPIVDVSDTTMAASGTTKKISINNVLGCSGTATLASATISGDLTVRTNKLAVTSTGVGIGTATPNGSTLLDVVGGTFARFNKGSANQYHLRIGNSAKDYGLYVDIDNNGTNGFALYDITAGADTLRYVPGVGGSWTHYVNGSTAMTLNSTGLGVGASPNISASGKALTISGAFTRSRLELQNTDGGTGGVTCGTISWFNGSNAIADITGAANSGSATLGSLAFSTGGSTRLTIDSSGNVGIGVTPSAWGSIYKTVEFANGSSVWGQTDIPQLSLQTNAFLNSSFQWIYKTTAAASNYRQTAGAHLWFTSPSGTAGNVITFTERLRLKETGQLRFVPLAADPAGAEAGDVYYNSTSNKLKCYNGTTWNDLF